MAESLLVGASLVNIFLAVWLVNARLYPMTVSLMPLLMHESQPRWKYYLSCHFIAVSAWLIMKSNHETIEKEKKKIFKRVKMRHKYGWRLPQIVYDKSCVNNSTTNQYNKASKEEAEKLVREFFTATLIK